jgi:hypothetical protein
VHSILFNRLVNSIQPGEITSDTFDVVYPVILDDSLNEQVDSQLRKAYDNVVKDGKGIVQVSFFTSQVKTGILYNTEKKIIWEQWNLPIIVAPRARDHGNLNALTVLFLNCVDRQERHAALSAAIKERLFAILRYADEKEDHILPSSSFGVSWSCVNCLNC